MAEVLVLVDHTDGEVKKVTSELLTLARRLGEPSAVFLGSGSISIKRLTDDGYQVVEASTPAVVSVVEKINEPRYPSFKGIMAAKKKPVASLTLADVGVDAGEVGLANALTTVTSASPKPPKSAGEKVTDEGDGGDKIASFLVGQKLI